MNEPEPHDMSWVNTAINVHTHAERKKKSSCKDWKKNIRNGEDFKVLSASKRNGRPRGCGWENITCIPTSEYTFLVLLLLQYVCLQLYYGGRKNETVGECKIFI